MSWLPYIALIYSLLLILLFYLGYKTWDKEQEKAKKQIDHWRKQAQYWSDHANGNAKRAAIWEDTADKYKKIAHQMVQNNLAKVSARVDEAYEGTVIEGHVLKADEDGQITIKIGEEGKYVDVDMELFKEDSNEALDRARYKWIETYLKDGADTDDEDNNVPLDE
jgi:hypothetical protein